MENKNQPKKRTQLSIIIRDPVEKLNRSGINCIKYEPSSSKSGSGNSQPQMDRLFTAGRDSTIRVYTNLTSSTGSILASNTSSLTSSSSSSYVSNKSLSPQRTDSDNAVDKFYQMSLSHHTDWVNDIVLCKYSKTVFSASSDTTVKIWNSTKGTLLNTLRLHKDYVKCLAYAKDKQLLASAGFDKNIFLWDVSQGVALNPNGMNVKSISDSKYSIYSLAINNQATILASGSPENCVRLWDPRTCDKVMKLKGHTHNIRCLALNRDGTQCLSASSDHTIRLWSLGQQRCISTIEIHTEGVWSLCVNESFTKVYSGGKDNRVYATDLRNLDESILVCEETAPVLSIDFGHEQESLWVSTINSSVKNWSLKASGEANTTSSAKTNSASSERSHQVTNQPQGHKLTNNSQNSATTLRNITANEVSVNRSSSSSSISSSFLSQSALNSQPVMVIKGTTSIKQYHVLNDKRFVVTKDSDENVCVWDVLQARKTEWLGKENYENAIKVRQRFISIPNWFTVDLKLGVLTVNIDENDWQAAWINFKDMDSNHVRQTQNIDLSEARVNYGYIFLESLFKNCTFLNPSKLDTCTNVVMPQSTSSQNQNNPDNKSPNKNEEHGQAGLLRFTIPDHTPVIFSEVAGRTLYRLDVKDMSKDSEQQPLSNVMPSWIVDALFGKTPPKFNRINFILNPYNQSQLKTVNKDRLISYDLLQVKKVKEYVYSKILKLDQITNNTLNNESTSNAQSFTSTQLQPSINDSNNNSNYKSNEINSNSSTTSANSYSNNQQAFTTSTNLTGTESTSVKEQFNVINRTIELICSDQILNDPDMNLRTVKHLIWKGNGDLTILFRTKP